MNLRDSLLAKERRFWTDGATDYRRTLDDDCLIAFSEAAGVTSRDTIAAQADGNHWHDLDFEVEGFLQPTEDVVLLTYRATAVSANDEPYEARVSSGYVCRDGDWKMMFHQQTPLPVEVAMSPNEREIRGVLQEFTRAIHDKDAGGAIATLAADEVTYDFAPPLQMGPRETHDPEALEEWFDTWQGPIVSESHDLKVAVGGDVAYAFGVQHMTGTKKGGEHVDMWFRATACFRRENGHWLISHMHNSVPFTMDGSKQALLDLRP